MNLSANKQTRNPIFGEGTGPYSPQKVMPFFPNKAYVEKPPQTDRLLKNTDPQRSVQHTPSVHQQNPITQLNANYQFTPENTPRVQCHYHFDQIITMFCKHPECYIPLCPQCIKIHSQEHQAQGSYGQFDTIENCLTESYSKLSSFCNKFADEIQLITKMFGSTGDGLQYQVEKLSKARAQAHQIVDVFFQTLEQELIQDIEKNHDFLKNQSSHFQKYLHQRWKQLYGFLEKMTKEKCVKNLIKYYSQNVEKDNELYFKESQHFIKQIDKFTPEIIIDQPGMYQLNLDLARFVTLRKGPAIQKNQFKSFESKQQPAYPDSQAYLNPPTAQSQIQQHNLQPNPSYPQYMTSEQQGPQSRQADVTPHYKAEELHPYLRTPPRSQQYNPYQPNMQARYPPNNNMYIENPQYAQY